MSSTFQNPALSVKSEVGTPRYLSLCKVGHIGVCFLLVCFSTAGDLGIIEKGLMYLSPDILDLVPEYQNVKT